MENKLNIAVVGANGKMGRLLCEKLEKMYKITKITEENALFDFINIDFVIDFSSASQSVLSAEYCAKNKIPLIIGATGHSKNQLKKIKLLSNHIPILMSGNFSIGIIIVKKLLRDIKKYLDNKKIDITIFEKHHNEKKDSPSGTALMLKNAIEEEFDCNINVLSERGGREIGTHQVDIYFDDELISISHKAFSREAFVVGVIKSIDVLLSKSESGLYDFEF